MGYTTNMIVENKKGQFDYEILETVEAGIVLDGAETKSFYESRVTLQGSFVRILDNEFYLVNAKFTLPTIPSNKQSRSRKLLVHKSEIIDWGNKIKEKKLAIIPISMYNKARFIKLKIGLAKSRREFSKKEKVQKRDLEREAARDYRAKLD